LQHELIDLLIQLWQERIELRLAAFLPGELGDGVLTLLLELGDCLGDNNLS
jgi:hypothetical protein